MADGLIVDLARAAAACYDPLREPWFQTKTCHVHKSVIDGVETFAFTGSDDLDDWVIDFLAVEISAYHHPTLGFVHLGFWENIQPAVDAIIKYLFQASFPAYRLTGHSKGAAEAILAHAILKDVFLNHKWLGRPAAPNALPECTIVFEPPRVGTFRLRSFLAEEISFTQTINHKGRDIATVVPCGMNWSDCGPSIAVPVPPALSIIQKHKMAAVLASLGAA